MIGYVIKVTSENKEIGYFHSYGYDNIIVFLNLKKSKRMLKDLCVSKGVEKELIKVEVNGL